MFQSQVISEVQMVDYLELTGQVRKDFDGMDYAEREARKRSAWELFLESTSIEDKARALWMVIEAHYDRSRAGYPGQHPDIEEFASHWLWANRDGWSWAGREIIDYLVESHPLPEQPRIRKGQL
jgi:hypothetical protein